MLMKENIKYDIFNCNAFCFMSLEHIKMDVRGLINIYGDVVECVDIPLFHDVVSLRAVSDARALAEAPFHPGLHRSLADRLGQRFPCLRSALCCASYPFSKTHARVCVCLCD